MRKLLTVIVYTIIVLIIGRNLQFLPKYYIFSTPQQEKDLFLSNLKMLTKQVIQKSPGNYGIYYADFTTGQSFGINEKEIFTGASVNKVPIVCVLYYLNNTGKISLDEVITLQADDIQDYGTGSLRYQDPGATYSLKTLAKLSIQQSDNTAAHILAKRIGMPVIQKIINSWGLTQTDMENNKTSPYDMYLLFKKIYRGEITSTARTQELFGYMIDTDIEDRLPLHLPNDVNVYHKTGDYQGGLHDVGIIQKEGTVFFISVLTSDVGRNEGKVKETIAEIAKTIFDAYQKKE